jgi:hypothetical protein
MKTKKITLQKTGLFFALAFLLAGCPDPTSGTLTEIYRYPKDLWGEWVRMDTGVYWYITSNSCTADSTGSITMTRQSDNVIAVAEGNRKYYLYASRIPNGSFSGSVVGDSPAKAGLSRSMTGMGGMILTISNLKDAANVITTSTDSEGNFTAEETIPGDEYEVTVGGQTTVVMPNTDGEDIGTVTITEGMNFKTSITRRNSSTDMMQLYNLVDYSFNIEVENTGVEDCQAAIYKLSIPPGLNEKDVSLEDILGTIEPGTKKTIPITVNCAFIPEESVYKTIELTITDTIAKKTWDDSVSLKFNQMTVKFNINSNSPVSGLIIVPTAKAYRFTTKSGSTSGLYSISGDLPRYSNKDYLVVFSGATAETEAKYSLGVDVAADTDFSGFLDTGNYEPNGTEDDAESLGSESKIMSYLHKNDIDYYRIRLDPLLPPQ